MQKRKDLVNSGIKVNCFGQISFINMYYNPNFKQNLKENVVFL